MAVIYVLWRRELQRYFQSRIQMFASLGQPLLYLFVLGFGFEPVYRSAARGSYLQFVSPGIIATTIVFAATFSGIVLLWDRQFGCLKEALVAPVPRVQIMIGRTCGAATVALLQGLIVLVVCLLVGFRPASLAALPAAAMFATLVAIAFAALGATIGSTLKDMHGLHTVMNLVVFPVFLLSGALFPLDNLPPSLTLLTSLDPLAYGVDGLRSTLSGQEHFSSTLNVTVLAASAVALCWAGAWRFSKIEV